MRFSYAELGWRVPLALAMFLNINISILCLVLHKILLGICLFGLSFVLASLISHRYPGEIKLYLNQIYNSNNYGKIIFDLKNVWGYRCVSVREKGLLFIDQNHYFFIKKDDYSINIYNDKLVIHSTELKPDRICCEISPRRKDYIEACLAKKN